MQLRKLAWTIVFVVGFSVACVQKAPLSRTAAPIASTQAASTVAATGQAAVPRKLEGRVVAVADGDTITILDGGNRQTRIRLQGIDAPESGQAFGHVSKRSLSDLVFNKQVVVEYEKTDRYGRTLGKVLTDGRDVCLEQVKAGLAWHYKYYQNEQSPEDRRLYGEAEQEARNSQRGLWADPNPIPPWDFRRGKHPAAEGYGVTASDPTPPAPAPTPATRRSADGPTAGATETNEETVYVTRTGSKYHRAGCQYLRHSQIPISLNDARRRYEPCSVCKPPQ
jgi:endonuclease YncB( thermonuclease family)